MARDDLYGLITDEELRELQREYDMFIGNQEKVYSEMNDAHRRAESQLSKQQREERANWYRDNPRMALARACGWLRVKV